jgi:hypothetical protein
MKSNQTPFKFNLGDYVAERPRLYGACATTEQGLEEYKKRDFQRYGTVIDRIILKDKRGARRKYIKVKWAHNNTVSVHEQMRLCAAKDIEAITNATRELIDF